ncbi:uncharacterized protein BYT42DRAFT_149276 [Radiomyces spectabilis]|uniref:uncharacterized protein n=1 Tax=Radiomyces spectabilis TaxID=64574 RepID=UPI00221E924A|nr:uncharacterized protein BYT42DRAFT_149276 [Radiomyces spectabilis]KAI8365995.1 hypothetical protein BYT42DRAFT_149276 [Radiomyces spectabilis]
MPGLNFLLGIFPLFGFLCIYCHLFCLCKPFVLFCFVLAALRHFQKYFLIFICRCNFLYPYQKELDFFFSLYRKVVLLFFIFFIHQ